MEGKLISFKELSLTHNKKVNIPRMQRDYAQGRNDSHAIRVRNSFLKYLKSNLINNEEVELDFIYGYSDNGSFIPLDGQQRLTTMFLLHWYLSIKENIDLSAYTKLFKDRLSYSTRYSSTEFVKELIKECNKPTFELIRKSVSSWINDQTWFHFNWTLDPTVNSMLNMLDSINNEFCDNNIPLFDRLDKIKFFFLEDTEVYFTKDIYITMNSRGASLTDFEHFKAHFLNLIKGLNYHNIESKIDNKWTYLFWQFRDKDNRYDNKFLNYIRYICEVLAFRNGLVPEEDYLRLADQVFHQNNQNYRDNIQYLIDAIDCWVDKNINKVFDDIFSTCYQSNKINYFDDKYNLFISLINIDEPISLSKKRESNLLIKERLFLFAFIEHFINKSNDFAKNLRILRNLLLNSENELRFDNFQFHLDGISDLIVKGSISNNSKLNKSIIEEENKKNQYLEKKPDMKECLYSLEDNQYLKGDIRLFDRESNSHEELKELATTFNNIFVSKNNNLTINKACLSSFFCINKRRGNEFKFLYSDTLWRETLTKFDKAFNENFLQFLKSVSAYKDSNGEFNFEDMVNQYIKRCKELNEYNLRYYILNYDMIGEFGYKFVNNSSFTILVSKMSDRSFTAGAFCTVCTDLFIKTILKQINLDKIEYVRYAGTNEHYTMNMVIKTKLFNMVSCRTLDNGFNLTFSSDTIENSEIIKKLLSSVTDNIDINKDNNVTCTINIIQEKKNNFLIDKTDRISLMCMILGKIMKQAEEAR